MRRDRIVKQASCRRVPGHPAADALTLIETAKLAGVNPEAWLADVLARLADHPINRLDELLPWHWKAACDAAAETA